MSDIQELWRKIKALFAGYADEGEQERAIKDVDAWDGSAARFDSTANYCRACLINVNPAAGRTAPEDWTQSHCMLPVREPGDAADVFVRQAVHAAAGGHGISQVKRPEDVPQEEWDAAVKRAANRLLQAYAEMEEDAPESLYTLAGKEPPTERAANMQQIYEALAQYASESSLYLIDLCVDGDGLLYAIASREGRLYQASVTVESGAAMAGEWQEVEVQYVPTPGMSVMRQADGTYRWVGIACSAVLNKDAQIDSTRLFERFVERFNQRHEDSGGIPLDFWHTDILLGTVDFLATDGYMLIDSGVFRNDAIGAAVAEALRAHPEEWGQSIAYMPLARPDRLEVGNGLAFPVWEDGELRRVALLPQEQAAAWFTTIQTRSVDMEPKILEALKRLVGEEQALALAAQVDGVNRRVEHEQLIAREVEGATPEPDATPTPSETPEAPEVRAVLEIRAALAESNAALVEIVRAVTDMDARLQLLERSEQQRREAWLADLPALQPRELVRPRDARPAEAAEKPADERVRETLSQKGIVI